MAWTGGLAAAGSAVGLQLLLVPGSSIIVRPACSLVGICFPVYSSFKSIESKDADEKEKWLIYWSVYGCLTLAETFSDKLLAWCPYYYHAKLALLIWLQLPGHYGANKLYVLLRSFLSQHADKIEKVLDNVKMTAKSWNNAAEGPALPPWVLQWARSARDELLAFGTPAPPPSSPPPPPPPPPNQGQGQGQGAPARRNSAHEGGQSDTPVSLGSVETDSLSPRGWVQVDAPSATAPSTPSAGPATGASPP